MKLFEQAKKLRQSLMNMTHCELDNEAKTEVVTFLMQVSEDNFRISAGGMFNVGMHLIPSVSGPITSMKLQI